MLPIQLSGNGVELTPTLQNFIHKKFNHLKKHSNNITHIHIFFNVSKLTQGIEATVHIPGHEISAKAESEDMYKTIDLVINKIIRQLEKYKSKVH